MLDPSKINRPVATVDRNAWYLRFYLWLWAADIEKVDFCRLFWGYVFAIPFLLVRILILVPLIAIYDGCLWVKRTGFWKLMDAFEWIIDRTVVPAWRTFHKVIKKLVPEGEPKPRESKPPMRIPRLEPVLPYRKPKPSKISTFFKKMRESGGEAFLSGVGKTADKGVEVGQRVWPYAKWFFVAIGAVFAAGIALVCGYLLWLLLGVVPIVASALATAFLAAVNGIWWFIDTLFSSKYIWIVPLGIIGIVGFSMFVFALFNSRPMKLAGTKTKKTTLGFGEAMKMGVKSVKYRTCPVIKVEE